MKKYEIIQARCTCSSGTIVREAKKHSFAPRCQTCQKTLKPSQWKVVDVVWSKTEFWAFVVYRNKLKIKTSDVGDFTVVGNFRVAVVKEGEEVVREFVNATASTGAIAEQPNAFLRASKYAKVVSKKRLVAYTAPTTKKKNTPPPVGYYY